jgi:hypothetical protein
MSVNTDAVNYGGLSMSLAAEIVGQLTRNEARWVRKASAISRAPALGATRCGVAATAGEVALFLVSVPLPTRALRRDIASYPTGVCSAAAQKRPRSGPRLCTHPYGSRTERPG